MVEVITPKQIRKALDVLLKNVVEKRQIDEIQFESPDGFYIKVWHKDRAQVMYDGKQLMSIGEVDDDIKRLKEILDGDTDGISPYDLERLGALLIQLGAVLGK